jgi:acetyl-CoA acetyltransferase
LCKPDRKEEEEKMQDITITGVGVTTFGKFDGQTLGSLGRSAITEAMADAGVTAADVDLVIHANAVGGLLTGQEMTRGQVVVATTDLAGLPLMNIENACASSSSALHLAQLAIASGQYGSVLVVGTEKMTGRGTRAALDALTSAADVARIDDFNRELTGRDGGAESFFMEVYARETAAYMEETGATARDFAEVAAKNSFHASLNPHAQYRTVRTPDEVLASRQVAGPLTMLMCSPIADGAAALVVQAADRVRPDRRDDAVRLRASVLRTGVPGGMDESLERRTILAAYEAAGVGPDDVDVAEVHDAASPNEMKMVEELGLCPFGDAAKLLAAGATRLGGRVPVNTSGGLVSKGHPVGATGAAQVVELVTQLRGRAGERQVKGARIGIAENAGGYSHPEPAACVVTIVSKD